MTLDANMFLLLQDSYTIPSTSYIYSILYKLTLIECIFLLITDIVSKFI